MIVFIYDGSFEGLLSAVYEAYYSNSKPDRIVPYREYELNFLYEEIHIVTDTEKYKRVSNSIKNKISELALEYIYNAFLSELPNTSTYIYDYIRLGFKIGSAITEHHTDETVIKVHDASLKTTREKHLLLGLVRFKKIKGDIYYSSINPDHNILTLLAPHFQDRLSDQRWIIHDVKRGLAAIYDKRSWIIRTVYSTPGDPFNYTNIKEASADIDYENLWRLYHKHISIETKRNIKLQKQHMPSRYWFHLPEKML
jgi:probable DNA metabolism protein